MWTKEQLWQALIYVSGFITLTLILALTYKFGTEILLTIIPFGVFALLIKMVLKRNINVSKEQVSQTERHITELTHYIDEQKRAGIILQKSEEKFRNAFDYAAVGMALVATTGKILKANESLCETLGFSEEKLINKDFLNLINNTDLKLFKQNLAIVLEGKAKSRNIEVRIDDKNDRNLWAICNMTLVPDVLNESAHYIFQIQDITDRKRAENQLEHDALHDDLTDLPNRVLFHDRLSFAFKRAKRHFDNNFAVLYLDFDRFKLVNDSYGHLVGDKILVEISKRLANNLRASDTVARLGGDEFCMLVEEVTNVEEALLVAERIQTEMAKPFIIDKNEIVLTVSVGLAGWSNDYEQPEFLLRDADTALFQAKKSGRNKCEIFNEQMHQEAQNLLQMESDLLKALESDEFYLQYQPILTLKNKKLSGFEALIRWNHPTKGFVPPLDFIPLAEETGLIIQIGEWVLRESCKQLKKWQTENGFDEKVFMSVNVSVKQFTQEDFTDIVMDILQETKISPESLKLEVTETAMIENINQAQVIMQKLFDTGIKLSIDDFGTGYSSLSYIHQLPLSSLKIDRSFVDQMDSTKETLEIIKTIISLAKSLNLEIIAEGIETGGQLDNLIMLACELGQGYFFAKPLMVEEVVARFSETGQLIDEIDINQELKAA